MNEILYNFIMKFFLFTQTWLFFSFFCLIDRTITNKKYTYTNTQNLARKSRKDDKVNFRKDFGQTEN